MPYLKSGPAHAVSEKLNTPIPSTPRDLVWTMAEANSRHTGPGVLKALSRPSEGTATVTAMRF